MAITEKRVIKIKKTKKKIYFIAALKNVPQLAHL
jgi:hypothetical protein